MHDRFLLGNILAYMHGERIEEHVKSSTDEPRTAGSGALPVAAQGKCVVLLPTGILGRVIVTVALAESAVLNEV
jgi:hypothetical protein